MTNINDVLREFEEKFPIRIYGPCGFPKYEFTIPEDLPLKIKDFITNTYNTAFEDGREEGQNTTTSILIPSLEPKDNVKELQKRIQTIEIINIKKEARKEVVEEILREMPERRQEERMEVSAMCYGFEWNQYREAIINLLNKKI